jgi:hypothetical protein
MWKFGLTVIDIWVEEISLITGFAHLLSSGGRIVEFTVIYFFETGLIL